MILTILSAVFVLGFLVFIHEFGHFIAAKLFKVRVERFSMGYPPRLFGKKIGETDYCVSAIPFGGFVKISGMVDESFDKEQLRGKPKPWELRSRPWYQKFAVIFSGPFMNILFAFLVFTAAVLIYGVGELSDEPVVGNLVENMPATTADIRVGDRIVSIEGTPIGSWDDLTKIIHGAPERTLAIVWSRGDSLFSRPLTTEKAEIKEGDSTRVIGQIGIYPQVNMRKAGVGKAFVSGAETLGNFSKLMIVSIYRLITGQESIKSLGGPVIIAKLAGESARSGFSSLIGFMAFLSLNLAILNLLPIPVLDGGHLMFLVIEAAIRREIPTKIKLAVLQVGMALLLGLMLFIIYQDIARVVAK